MPSIRSIRFQQPAAAAPAAALGAPPTADPPLPSPDGATRLDSTANFSPAISLSSNTTHFNRWLMGHIYSFPSIYHLFTEIDAVMFDWTLNNVNVGHVSIDGLWIIFSHFHLFIIYLPRLDAVIFNWRRWLGE